MSAINYANCNMQFDRKGYGRFFVEKDEDISKVEAIMREIDQSEFDGYYPTRGYKDPDEELIVKFSPENYKSVYVGKFDEMDMGLVCKKAWEQGIKCFCIIGKCNQYDSL